MRQLLLRVEDSLHARLTIRARTEQRSVNALANEILSLAAAGDASPRSQLRTRAAALGLLASPLDDPGGRPPLRAGERDRILAETRGIGPVLDQILAEDRDRV